MKKFLFLSLAALVLAGCHNNEKKVYTPKNETEKEIMKSVQLAKDKAGFINKEFGNLHVTNIHVRGEYACAETQWDKASVVSISVYLKKAPDLIADKAKEKFGTSWVPRGTVTGDMASCDKKLDDLIKQQ